jgi:hypothetical protein
VRAWALEIKEGAGVVMVCVLIFVVLFSLYRLLFCFIVYFCRILRGVGV